MDCLLEHTDYNLSELDNLFLRWNWRYHYAVSSRRDPRVTSSYKIPMLRRYLFISWIYSPWQCHFSTYNMRRLECGAFKRDMKISFYLWSIPSRIYLLDNSISTDTRLEKKKKICVSRNFVWCYGFKITMWFARGMFPFFFVFLFFSCRSLLSHVENNVLFSIRYLFNAICLSRHKFFKDWFFLFCFFFFTWVIKAISRCIELNLLPWGNVVCAIRIKIG